jgi:hypothetical protein
VKAPGLWGRFVARLAHKEPATPLALFRIAVAAILLGTFSDMVLTGVVPPVWFDVDQGGAYSLRGGQWLVAALGGATPEAVWPLLGLSMLGSLLLLLGLGGRVTAFVVLQGCIALFSINPSAGGGHDKLLTNALWLLVLSPATATLSLDARIRTGAWRSDRAVAAWPRYIAIFQIALVYGLTGIQKLGAEWMPWGGFSALYYSLLLPSWARFDLSFIAWIYPLTQLATALTWIWEVTWPSVLLAFYFRATWQRPGHLRALSNRLDWRRLYVLIGIGVHLGIWATMNVGPFSFASMAFYLCLFHHDEYTALAQRLRGWRQRPERLQLGPTAEGPPAG